MNNNDKFFDMFKDSLEGYSPRVAESVHAGLRSKMRMNGFFQFSISSLNIWTILAMTALGSGLWYSTFQSARFEAKKIDFRSENNLSIVREIAPASKTKSFVAIAENSYSSPNSTIKAKKTNHFLPNKTKTTYINEKTSLDQPNSKIGISLPEKEEETPLKPNSKDKETNPEKMFPKKIEDGKYEDIQENNKNNNQFWGLIKTRKIQSVSKGINTELKSKSKKDFTIKIKVPK